MLEGPLASVDEMCERTRVRLVAHREAGGSDEQFAAGLIHEFVEQAKLHPAGAGALHMALTLYQMVLLREENWELKDAVAMRDDALNVLFDIRDLP